MPRQAREREREAELKRAAAASIRETKMKKQMKITKNEGEFVMWVRDEKMRLDDYSTLDTDNDTDGYGDRGEYCLWRERERASVVPLID